MTTTLRIEDSLKSELDDVFDQIGITMTSAINIFLRQVVRSRGIPFEINCAEPRRYEYARTRRVRNEALAALDAISAERLANNERELSMDEIDAEIAEARRERERSARRNSVQ